VEQADEAPEQMRGTAGWLDRIQYACAYIYFVLDKGEQYEIVQKCAGNDAYCHVIWGL